MIHPSVGDTLPTLDKNMVNVFNTGVLLLHWASCLLSSSGKIELKLYFLKDNCKNSFVN
jgi:hypothetical protein